MYVRFRPDRGRTKVHLTRCVRTPEGPRQEHVAVLGWVPDDAATECFDRYCFWRRTHAVLDDLETGNVLGRYDRYDLVDKIAKRIPIPVLEELGCVNLCSLVVIAREMRAEGRPSNEIESAIEMLIHPPENHAITMLRTIDLAQLAKQIQALHRKTRDGLRGAGKPPWEDLDAISYAELTARRDRIVVAIRAHELERSRQLPQEP